MASIPKSPSPYARVGAKLVDQGWRAIPCRPHSKRPGVYSSGIWYGNLGWNEYCDRMPTDAEVDTWSAWPDGGVCVALDRQIKVIDVDTDNEEIRRVLAEIIPDSPVRKRGQKGYSAFFRGSEKIVSKPFNVAIFGKQERIVDLLAHGRQTVCPPTLHPDTMEPYQWLCDPLEDYTPDQLPLLDDNIAERIEEVLRPFGYLEPIVHERVAGEYTGTIWRDINNHALENLDTWVPSLRLPKAKRSADGRWRAVAEWRGVDNSNLSFSNKGITDWGNSETHTPLDVVMKAFSIGLEQASDWLKEKTGFKVPGADFDVRSFIANTERKKRDRAPQPTPAPASAPAPTVPAPRKDIAIYNPFTPSEAGGLMGAISQWAYDTSRRPVPEFSILAAVAFMSVLFGRRCVGPTGAGLNMYLVGIAGPGFGKEHPLKVTQTLAVDCQMPYLIGPGEVTSGAAIEKVVRRRPVFLMPWDEMGVVMQSVTGRGSTSWAQTIRKVLLEVFSKSTGMWSGKEHADPDKDSSAEPVHCPTVSLMGMSTPTTFYRGITEESLTDGFVARMVVVEPSARPERHSAPPVLVASPSLVASVKKWSDSLPKPPTGNIAAVRMATQRPPLYTVPWADEEAERRWMEIEDWQISEIDEKRAQEGIVGRTAEHTIKLATMRAISRFPEQPAVDVSDVEWGHAIVQRSIQSINRGVEEHMAGSAFEELCKAILTALRGTKGGSLPKSVLVRKRGVSKADDRMVDQAVKRLLLSGEISEPEVAKGGGRIALVRAAEAA